MAPRQPEPKKKPDHIVRAIYFALSLCAADALDQTIATSAGLQPVTCEQTVTNSEQTEFEGFKRNTQSTECVSGFEVGGSPEGYLFIAGILGYYRKQKLNKLDKEN